MHNDERYSRSQCPKRRTSTKKYCLLLNIRITRSQRKWIKYLALFGLLVVAILISVQLNREIRNKSVQQLVDDYEKCECTLHDWPDARNSINADNPFVSTTLFCASGTYEAEKQISTSNGHLMYRMDVNQTCFRPYDDTEFLRVGVADLGWTDATHAIVLILAFATGILCTIFRC